VYVLNADGSGKTFLGAGGGPVWSPDGTQIAYTSGSPASTWIMNADGSAKTNIPPANEWGEGPSDWHPLTGPLPAPIAATTTTIYRPPPVEPPATFAPAATYPVGDWNPWQVAVADFNRDGNQDMAVAEPLGEHPEDNVAGDVAVLLGTGDGTFGPASHLPYESPGIPPAPISPRSVAVGDFNEDGIADLAVANSGGGGLYDVSLFAGLGDGSFAPPATFGTGTTGRPHMLVVDDLNGDGFDDVAMANFEPPPNGGDVSVLLGTGTASLGPATNYPTGFGTTSIATGDFNEDGRRDVVVTNLLAGSLLLRLGTGDGTFGPASHLPYESPGIPPAPISPRSVAVG
ncbi:MAG: FG-GAP-like repeat-containing protein, partial [Actinobacteria bacterium]|nr:FG-GAP-like repeat-containing protein [Actinomycetota bacterium]